MADWTDILDSQLDPDAPLTSSLAFAWRDNPIAIAEGAANAPRVWLPALERLAPGDSIRYRQDSLVTVSGSTFTAVPLFTIDLMQAGSIRITFEHRRFSSNSSEVRLRRYRGTSSAVTSAVSNNTSTFVENAIDIDVQPGDRVIVEHRLTSSGDAEIRNVRLKVATTNYFWPCGTMLSASTGNNRVEGNPTLTAT